MHFDDIGLLIDEYRETLMLALFPKPSAGGVVVISSDFGDVPDALFPEWCELITVTEPEGYLDTVAEVISTKHPNRLLLLPPWDKYPSGQPRSSGQLQFHNHAQTALVHAVNAIGENAYVGAILPEQLVTGNNETPFREYIIGHTTVAYLIEHRHALQLLGLTSFHRLMRANTIVLQKSVTSRRPAKFFSMPVPSEIADPESVLSDFRVLAERQSGQTLFGFVVPSGFPAELPWRFSLLHPSWQRKQEELSSLGGLEPLSNLAEIFAGSAASYATRSQQEDSSSSDRNIPVLDGRHIRIDGAPLLDELQYRVQVVAGMNLLQLGDICIRRIVAPTDRTLYVTSVSSQILPRVASQSVIVIRPLSALPPDQIEYLRAYLRSPHAINQLRTRFGLTVTIGTQSLSQLQVPIADDWIRTAFRDLQKASTDFHNWQAECQLSVNMLFQSKSISDARHVLQTTERRVRQRHAAAQQVDDSSFRIRTQYPYPIASWWRVVETSEQDTDGYSNLLECAEVTACYLAWVAFVAAKLASGEVIKSALKMASNLEGRASGTTVVL